MGKALKPTTNIMDKSIIAMVARQDALKQKFGLVLGTFSQSNTSLSPYDESNIKYKEYEEAEIRANQLVSQNKDIPVDLQQYLLKTKEERTKWHEYCRTHYRKPKSSANEADLENLFD